MKKLNVVQKIEYLESNLAVIHSQRNIDALESIGKFYKRHKYLSDGQETYIDIIIDNVKKIRGV